VTKNLMFLLFRTSSVTVENLVFVNCNSTSSVIVLSPRCNGERNEGASQLNRLTFQDNGVLGQVHIIGAIGRCSRLHINGLVFLRNRCISTHCVVLGARNMLRDIYLLSNQGSSEASLDSSIFFASTVSDTNASEVTSLNNTIKSFYVSNGTLKMLDSQFNGNGRNDLSGRRDNSIGGGVLFSNHSSISITNTTFERNSAFSGGALFAWSSNVSVNECAFRENDALGGNGGALYGHHNSSFDISLSEISRNRGYRGAGLYSNYTLRVTMVNDNISENYCSRFGAISITSGVARIRLCSFYQNTAFEGAGALGTRTMELSLMDSTFTGNSASFGGACIFEYASIVRASALSFESNMASETDGGGIFFSLGGCMRIRDSLFRNNQASSDGGAIYTTPACETVLKRVIFSNNTSGDYAGALQIWRGSFSGSDLTFERNRATNHGGAISFFEATNVSVSSSHFEINNAGSGGAIQFYLTIVGYVDQCTFVRNSGFLAGGGAVYATTSNVNISASFFRENTAPSGGAITSFSFSNSTISNSRFVSNSAERTGGAVAVHSSSVLVLSNASFASNAIEVDPQTLKLSIDLIGNRGVLGGALLASSNSNLSGSRLEFEENHASSGGGLHLINSAIARISDSLFSNNTARNEGGAIDSSDNCYLSIFDARFICKSLLTLHYTSVFR